MNSITKFRLCTLTDVELVERVDIMTDQMFETQKVPTRQIPARPNDDFDLLVGELITRFYEKVIKPSDVTMLEPEPGQLYDPLENPDGLRFKFYESIDQQPVGPITKIIMTSNGEQTI